MSERRSEGTNGRRSSDYSPPHVGRLVTILTSAASMVIGGCFLGLIVWVVGGVKDVIKDQVTATEANTKAVEEQGVKIDENGTAIDALTAKLGVNGSLEQRLRAIEMRMEAVEQRLP